mgnify:CR=1 FL=1
MRVDFDRIKERMTVLWDHEILDRCCVSVVYEEQAEKEAIDAFPASDEDRMKYWTDPEIVLKRNRRHMEHNILCGGCLSAGFAEPGSCRPCRVCKEYEMEL